MGKTTNKPNMRKAKTKARRVLMLRSMGDKTGVVDMVFQKENKRAQVAARTWEKRYSNRFAASSSSSSSTYAAFLPFGIQHEQ